MDKLHFPINLDHYGNADALDLWADTFEEHCRLDPTNGVTKRTQELLLVYARGKAQAMRYREQGRISLALEYDVLCETTYEKLPPLYKW